jgi:hypothetical protein
VRFRIASFVGAPLAAPAVSPLQPRSSKPDTPHLQLPTDPTCLLNFPRSRGQSFKSSAGVTEVLVRQLRFSSGHDFAVCGKSTFSVISDFWSPVDSIGVLKPDPSGARDLLSQYSRKKQILRRLPRRTARNGTPGRKHTSRHCLTPNFPHLHRNRAFRTCPPAASVDARGIA